MLVIGKSKFLIRVTTMATTVLKPAETQKTCDMCNEVKKHFFTNGSASMGYVQSQSDRWEKTIDIKLSSSIPYHPSDDICTDCAKIAMDKIIKKIEGDES